MRSYKLILPESMAGHITYSKEKLRACSGLSKYFNVKWGISLLATALVINLSQRPPVDTQHSRCFCLITSGVE